MKIKKEHRKIAKKLIGETIENERPNENKIKELFSLVKKRFKSEALAILSAYIQILKTRLDQSNLVIETPIELKLEQIDEIRDYFERQTGKSLSVETTINTSLLGGFRAVIGSREWDLSVKNKLFQIKENLINATN